MYRWNETRFRISDLKREREKTTISLTKKQQTLTNYYAFVNTHLLYVYLGPHKKNHKWRRRKQQTKKPCRRVENKKKHTRNYVEATQSNENKSLIMWRKQKTYYGEWREKAKKSTKYLDVCLLSSQCVHCSCTCILLWLFITNERKKVIVVTYKRFFSSLLSVRNIKNAVTTTVEASFEWN